MNYLLHDRDDNTFILLAINDQQQIVGVGRNDCNTCWFEACDLDRLTTIRPENSVHLNSFQNYLNDGNLEIAISDISLPIDLDHYPELFL